MKPKVPNLLQPLEQKRTFEDEIKKNRFKKKNLSFDKEKSVFRWYSEKSFESHIDRENLFTNFLPKLLDTDTEMRINELCESLDCLDLKKITQVTHIENNPKLRGICKHYLEEGIDPRYSDYVYKVNFSNSLGVTTSFRVFVLYEADGVNDKYYKSVIFLDPYHMVISSGHDGKSKEETLKATFKKHQNNFVNLKSHIQVKIPQP